MMIRKLNVVWLFLCIATIATAQKSEVINAYIKSYRAIAIAEMQRTGVPASIKLAQGIHETMAGQSDLVLKSNNHFGIKCKEGYDGPFVLHDDDARNERFVKYENPEQSYIDHSNFLRGRARYAALFELDPTDYKNWAYGLKKAGYATNPKYPQIIINLIEKYNLQDYTLIAMGKMEMPQDLQQYASVKNIEELKPEITRYPKTEFKINDTRVVYARKGANLSELAKKYNVPEKRLYDFNDFKDFSGILNSDQLVFLQLKRTVGQKEFHEVINGESIFDIAQSEGIRLESLLKYNNLSKFASPAIGSKLYLQDMSPNKIAVN